MSMNMALSVMGMATEVVSDAVVVGYCDYGDVGDASEVTTDTEESDDEEEEEEYAFTPRAFERCTLPRSSKRTYGVVADGGGVGGVERRKRRRIDDQLELLRAAIPNLCTNEKASILAGAYEYIEKLQRQVQELQSELDTEAGCSDDDEGSSCEDGASAVEERLVDSNACVEATEAEWRGCSRSTVAVVRSEEGTLKIHVECEKRPRVLADIMEMLESSGMSVEEVSILYQEDSQFVFDCVGCEVEGEGIVADCRHVEACLRSLIAEERDDVDASP